MSIALELWRVLEAWDADLHPRGPGGKFVKGLGGGGRKHSLADAVKGTAEGGPKRQRKDKAGMSVADAVRKAARTSDTTGRPTQRSDAEHRAHGAHDVADEVDRALAEAGVSESVRAAISGRARARADTHGPRPDTLKAPSAPKASADAPGGVDAAKADIRQAVGEIAPRGEWVGLADLRDRLGDRHSRADVDKALDSLVDDPDIRIIPVANTKALSDRDRRAAVQIGGEDSHAIMLTAAPATKAEVPAKALPGAEVRQRKVDAAKADVRSAVGRLQAGPGEWVGLARLRDDLGEKHNRHVVDAALKALEREPDVNIVPESKRVSLTAADHSSAVQIGNQDKHLIAIGAGGSPAGLKAERLTPPSAADHEAKVRGAYDQLAAQQGDWVGIADLREQLGGSRGEQDTAIRSLLHKPGWQIEEETNQKSLSQKDRAGAINIGNRDQHAISFQKPAARRASSSTTGAAGDGLDRYRTTEDQYRQHYDGYTDDELASAGRTEGVETAGRSRSGIIFDLAYTRALQDRKVLEQNLAERRAGSGAGSVQTRPAGVGGNAERTEITGAWKGGRSSGSAAAAKAKRDKIPTQAEPDADVRAARGGIGLETGKQAWDLLLSGPQKEKPAERPKLSAAEEAARRRKVLDRTAATLGGGAPKRANVFANPEFSNSTGGAPAGTPLGKARAAHAEVVQQLAAALRSAKSRDDARSAISALNVRELRGLAEHLELKPGSKATKPKLLDAIVDGTAGRRLDSEAIGRSVPQRNPHDVIMGLDFNRTALPSDIPPPEHLARLSEGTLRNMAASTPGSPLANAALAELRRR